MIKRHFNKFEPRIWGLVYGRLYECDEVVDALSCDGRVYNLMRYLIDIEKIDKEKVEILLCRFFRSIKKD
jgi:hypothetical protein